jgi:predicted transcriptional regulator
LLPGGTVVTLNSPAELMQALQQRNLAEVRHYMVRDYVSNNPHHLDEVRELIKQHEAKRK